MSAQPTTRAETWESAVRRLVADPARGDEARANYFDAPLREAAERYAASAEWAAVQALIGPPNGVAVDVGAGNGIVSHALAKAGWTVIAVEPDPSDFVGAGAIAALAAETGAAIEVRGGFGEALPVRDGQAHVVLARQVLHHAHDLPAFARDVARALAPGGLLLSWRDHVVTGPAQLEAFLRAHPLHDLYGGENAFTRAQYRSALTEAGLMITREFGALDSVLNYAPHTENSLLHEIARRTGPLAPLTHSVLSARPALSGARRLLSLLDRRPGRHIAFLCRKLGEL